jgi:hypothetical protein
VRGDGGVAGTLGQADGVQGLGQRTDLVDLDQQRVGGLGVDAALQDGGVGDEQVVTNQLDLVTDGVGEGLPAVPVVFVRSAAHLAVLPLPAYRPAGLGGGLTRLTR